MSTGALEEDGVEATGRGQVVVESIPREEAMMPRSVHAKMHRAAVQ